MLAIMGGYFAFMELFFVLSVLHLLQLNGTLQFRRFLFLLMWEHAAMVGKSSGECEMYDWSKLCFLR